jgi:hypothetical protein
MILRISPIFRRGEVWDFVACQLDNLLCMIMCRKRAKKNVLQTTMLDASVCSDGPVDLPKVTKGGQSSTFSKGAYRIGGIALAGVSRKLLNITPTS